MPGPTHDDSLGIIPKDEIDQDLEEDCSPHDALLHTINNGYLQAIERTIRSILRKCHARMPGMFQVEYDFLISLYCGKKKETRPETAEPSFVHRYYRD
jgi:hypothetical protein